MIVKNFLEADYERVALHEGKGTAKSVALFGEEDFHTDLKFIHYTELEPGTSIGYHPHGEDEEVYAILAGNGLMSVNGQTREVKTGDVVLNKPGWSHGLENHSDRTLKILVFAVAKGVHNGH